MANLCIFTQDRPLTLKLGYLFGEILLVNLIKLVWEHPLVANFGNWALVVDLSIASWWLIMETWLKFTPGG